MDTSQNQNRRTFIKNTAVTSAGIILNTNGLADFKKPKNKLPKWKGFNLLDFFNPDPTKAHITPEEYFKWVQDWGFDYIRIPMAYPSYIKFDRSRNILPDETRNIDTQMTDKIENLVHLAHKYGQHVSLNLHRAPGRRTWFTLMIRWSCALILLSAWLMVATSGRFAQRRSASRSRDAASGAVAGEGLDASDATDGGSRRAGEHPAATAARRTRPARLTGLRFSSSARRRRDGACTGVG